MLSFFLFLLILFAFADIPPPKKCPAGTHLIGRTECVKDGHVLIYLFDVIPWKSDLSPAEAAAQLKSGELVIPDLDISGIRIEGETLEVREDAEKKIEKRLKAFFQTQHLETESKKEKQHVAESKKESSSCSQASISESLFLVLWSSIFSGLRRGI